ncbi:G-protein coupled receptor GRL101-like isoform X2 [Patiria miniata]|uniref:G-protein coupled receptors family 1 profile domain-containing protein n=1 Tax=Patiria miniata TaxID=46514 RepID=A0A914AHF6_PATMI|nr:G-protein coupled receptor GRL101-like isoform X2 [Patiria miniata]
MSRCCLLGATGQPIHVYIISLFVLRLFFSRPDSQINTFPLESIPNGAFSELPSLYTLYLVNLPLVSISANTFRGLSNLRTLRLINLPLVSIPEGAFGGLFSLETLHVDEYRVCCALSKLHHFSIEQNCSTVKRRPDLNLCDSLMPNSILRAMLWALGLSALIGNLCFLIWRLTQKGVGGGKKTLSIMVGNLAMADFMMGVYMLIIAGADLSFGDDYFLVAPKWRSSIMCKLAGVLSVLSSEASVFFVTLISVDCFLGIVFPWKNFSLGTKSTTVIIVVLWFLALCLSIVPTLSFGSGSDVYGLSDVCIGLPLTTKASGVTTFGKKYTDGWGWDLGMDISQTTGEKPSWILSIILFLGVNLVSFLLVLCCYVAIFISVKRTASAVRTNAHREREVKMAAKMALIVMTDFCCWMPVIILGILSQTGTVSLSTEVYAWVVVLGLPINSSLNPFLYTFFTVCCATKPKAKAAKRNQLELTNMNKVKKHTKAVVDTGGGGVKAVFPGKKRS